MALPPSKYKFEGIGKASALATFAALAATPLAPITQGFWGKIVFQLLVWFYSRLAGLGLVTLNIGVEYVKEISQKSDFDASFDEAFKIINSKGGALTDAEIKAIDDKVIAAHNKFGTFGKLRDR